MAPEEVADVVLLDLRLENGRLRGSVESVPKSGARLRVLWNAEERPEGFFPIGPDVAFVLEESAGKRAKYNVVLDPSGGSFFRLAFLRVRGINDDSRVSRRIYLLDADPETSKGQGYQRRTDPAFWLFQRKSGGHPEVGWKLVELRGDPQPEIEEINRLAPPQEKVASPEGVELVGFQPSEDLGNPWKSGSFYLVAALIILLALVLVAKNISIWIFPLVIAAGVLLLVVMGALQLKQDNRLKDEGFVKLMGLALRTIPVLFRKPTAKPPRD